MKLMMTYYLKIQLLSQKRISFFPICDFIDCEIENLIPKMPVTTYLADYCYIVFKKV